MYYEDLNEKKKETYHFWSFWNESGNNGCRGEETVSVLPMTRWQQSTMVSFTMDGDVVDDDGRKRKRERERKKEDVT